MDNGSDNVWDMMLGKTGKLPGQLAPELVKWQKNRREFYTGNPQTFMPINSMSSVPK